LTGAASPEYDKTNANPKPEVDQLVLTKDELKTFYNFGTVMIDNYHVSSLEDCLRPWHEDREYAETVAAIREGFDDSAAGRTQPIDQAFADIRRDLGLPERRPVP
jgi:hypothetical protein